MNIEEHMLRQRLAELHKQYKEAAQPFIDRLVFIEAMKMRPPPLIYTKEQLDFLEMKIKEMEP